MSTPTPGTYSLRERIAEWALYQGAVRWGMLLGTPAAAAAAASLLTFVANAGILRLLPKSDAGHYALWFAVGQGIASLSQVGQGSILTRAYVRRDFGDYDWLRDFAVSMGIVGSVASVAAVLASLLYQLTALIGLYLFVLALVLASTYLLSAILAAHRHYVSAALTLRLPNSLLVVTLPLLLILPERMGLPIVLVAPLLTGLISVTRGITTLLKHVPRGKARVTIQERISGSIFMVSSANNVVPEQGLVAIAGIFVPPSELASLAALTTLVRPMQLLQDVFYRVFLTEVGRRARMRYSRILGGLWLLATAGGITIAVIGPSVAHWAYGGRYDQALGLLPWLALTSILKLAETFPRSHMVGAASMTTVRRYTLVTILTAAISLGIGLGLTTLYGLQGTVMAGSAIYSLRNVISYSFLIIIWWERGQSTV